MFDSTTMRPVTAQTLANSSMTREVSRNPSPWPPSGWGTVIPMKPASRSRSTMSHGYSRVSSISAARPAT